jgi:hypothetical protein
MEQQRPILIPSPSAAPHFSFLGKPDFVPLSASCAHCRAEELEAGVAVAWSTLLFSPDVGRTTGDTVSGASLVIRGEPAGRWTLVTAGGQAGREGWTWMVGLAPSWAGHKVSCNLESSPWFTCYPAHTLFICLCSCLNKAENRTNRKEKIILKANKTEHVIL